MARRRTRRRKSHRRRSRHRRSSKKRKRRRKRTRKRKAGFGGVCPRYNGNGRDSRGRRVMRASKKRNWLGQCKYYYASNPMREFTA